jgi:predicted ABC-type ATPase
MDGSPPVAGAAAGLLPRCWQQAAPAATVPQRRTRTDSRAVLRSPGSLSPRKITIKGAPLARPRCAGQTLDTDLPRQDLGTYQEDGRAAEGSLSQVVRLIHLNGPPGIGKSTIASVFADRHPGVLNLDIDRVAAMIGGWGDSFSDSFEAGRLLAAAMARVHLANGHDVIMPQMMTHINVGELADFESAAAAAKAEFCQILLTANVESSVDRCMERAKAGDPRRDVVSKVIIENGGRDFVRMLHAQVAQFSADRQPHAVIDCERLTVEQTCQAVEAALRPS